MINIKKLEITDEHLEKLSKTKKSIKIGYNVARNVEYQRFFKPGEVLIMYDKINNRVRDENGIPTRYIVARNDGGLVYCKQITNSGAIGTGIIPIFVDNFNNIEYQYDPDQVDSIVLGTEYDPQAARKHYTKIVKALKHRNNDIRIFFDWEDKQRLEKYEAWVKTLKVGDSLWEDNMRDGREILCYTITHIDNLNCIRISGHKYKAKLDINSFSSSYCHMYSKEPISFERMEVLIKEKGR
jgi:hypothetical protein